MVNSIKIISEPKGQFNYLRRLSRDKNIARLYGMLEEKGVEFKPGLNYIVGENGSGKSTLLNIIRSANMCERSFIPKPGSLRMTTIKELNEVFDSFEVRGDYSCPVFNLYRFFEDKKNIGSRGNVDTFDDMKLFMSGKEESKGQNLLGDINTLFNWIFGRQPECFPMTKYIIDWHEAGDFKEATDLLPENGTTTKLLDNIKKNNVGSEESAYTILMDEPDQGLDIHNLKEIYGIVSYNKPNTQLIVALHNPLIIYKLMKQVDGNWIETSPNYLEMVKEEVEEFYEWMSE